MKTKKYIEKLKENFIRIINLLNKMYGNRLEKL